MKRGCQERQPRFFMEQQTGKQNLFQKRFLIKCLTFFQSRSIFILPAVITVGNIVGGMLDEEEYHQRADC